MQLCHCLKLIRLQVDASTYFVSLPENGMKQISTYCLQVVIIFFCTRGIAGWNSLLLIVNPGEILCVTYRE